LLPAGLQSGNGDIDGSQRSVRISASSSKNQKLNSMLFDILHQRQATKEVTGTEEVQVKGMLGQGKQGKVMLGRWRGVDVAYKVIQLPPRLRKTDTAEARALLEMAISATMAHPNVVQTYSYEMVVIKAGQPGAQGSGADGVCDIERPPGSGGEEHEMDGSAIMDAAEAMQEAAAGQSYQEARLIQELCDMNTLRHNLDSKSLCSKGEPLPNVGLMTMLAHDVACGLQHIHWQNIVHGDIKALNVLLCSSTRKAPIADTRLPKVIAKVSDFGMSAHLAPEETHVSNVTSGTVTHMAPEILLTGKLSKAADVYAFGILLYEMFSGARAFEGQTMQQVIHGVSTKGMRPRFPSSVPVRIVELACRCWGPGSSRPVFGEIVDNLRELTTSAAVGNWPPSRSALDGFSGNINPTGSAAATNDSIRALQMIGQSSEAVKPSSRRLADGAARDRSIGGSSKDSIRALQMTGQPSEAVKPSGGRSTDPEVGDRSTCSSSKDSIRALQMTGQPSEAVKPSGGRSTDPEVGDRSTCSSSKDSIRALQMTGQPSEAVKLSSGRSMDPAAGDKSTGATSEAGIRVLHMTGQSPEAARQAVFPQVSGPREGRKDHRHYFRGWHQGPADDRAVVSRGPVTRSAGSWSAGRAAGDRSTGTTSVDGINALLKLGQSSEAVKASSRQTTNLSAAGTTTGATVEDGVKALQVSGQSSEATRSLPVPWQAAGGGDHGIGSSARFTDELQEQRSDFRGSGRPSLEEIMIRTLHMSGQLSDATVKRAQANST